jgi:hypothetical protein
MPAKQSPLQEAAEGKKKLSDKQKDSAIGEAVGKIAGLTKRATRNKEAVLETGVLVLHTAETQGSLFLASLGEGYFGAEKMKVGGLDLRAPTGLLLSGYGLYETLSGGKGGGHALAIGNGVMGSWLASVGVNAGRTLAEKKGQPQVQQVQQPQPQVIVTQGVPQPHLIAGPSFIPEQSLAGPAREVMLTPEPSARGVPEDSTEGRRRGGRGGGRGGGGGGGGGRRGRMGQGGQRRPNRFVRPDEEEDEA